MELYERLESYAASDFYPWHMPGHKRRVVEFGNPFSIDITEIDGFDDLHHPEGILKESMEEAAGVYGSEKTYFLVNGSSCGILAAVSAVVKPGGKLLMARNCHKSAYHGALLRQAEVTYVYPKLEKEGFYGELRAEDVEEALKKDPEIGAVIMVSPGYEGVVSDIEEIARVAHTYGCALIVDEAHGAHFSFAAKNLFPASALEKGADVVIQSLHKTLPSLTQTALLHLGRGSGAYVAREAIEFYLRIYQSSSPSYVLMASMDHCIRFMSGEQGKKLMAEYAGNLFAARNKLKKELKLLRLYEPAYAKECFYDPSKFVIVAPENGWAGEGRMADGSWLAEMLRDRYHLEPEMNTDRYVILMSSPADSEEGFSRMADALLDLDQDLKEKERGYEKESAFLSAGFLSAGALLPCIPPANAMKSAEANAALGEWILLSQSENRIAHDFIYIYPPGIPLLVPGERIGRMELETIRNYQKHSLEVHGIKDGAFIQVVDTGN